MARAARLNPTANWCAGTSPCATPIRRPPPLPRRLLLQSSSTTPNSSRANSASNSPTALGGSAPPVPQCGFAHHALDAFLPRLLARRGYRVAVGEGSEDGGGLRRARVVRTLTPGTVTDPRLLREDRPTYLAALVSGNDRLGLAWADAAAGEFKARASSTRRKRRRTPGASAHRSPRLPRPPRRPTLVARRNVTPVKSSAGAAAALRDAFPNADLSDLPQAQAAAGLVALFRRDPGRRRAAMLDVPTVADSDDGMRLDASTQRHLELVETERGREHAGSLLATLDRTVTANGPPHGARLGPAPLTDASPRSPPRQRIVSELVADNALRTALGTCLAELADLERLAGRAAAVARPPATSTRLPPSLPCCRALDSASAECAPSSACSAARARPRRLRRIRERCALLGRRGGHRAPGASPTLAEATERVRGAADWQARYLSTCAACPTPGRVKLERTGTQDSSWRCRPARPSPPTGSGAAPCSAPSATPPRARRSRRRAG
ncbi:MAG: hypothetical protein U0232_13915 [Thermomicrobiales bacterium]